MHRRQFEAYLEKVFHFSARVGALPEGRKSPRRPWPKVFDSVFLGGAIQIPNVHRLEAECGQGVLRQRIGKLSEDTIGYALQRQDPASIFALGCEVARRLKRNGVLGSSWARGRVVAAVDGIEICSSFVRCCDACMERTVQHLADGQRREDTQYYHRIVAVVLVSTDFPVPLGIRFQRDGEGEVACAVALLQELDRPLGRRFLDVLVADALYLQSGFVKEVENLHLEWVITVKENQPELLAEAQRLTGGQALMSWSTPQDEFQLWHAPEVYWPVADRSLRVVKTFRIQKGHRVELTPPGSPKKKRTKEAVREESTNYYARNLELGSIPPTFIHQLGRSRWRVDTEAFQTLTTQAHLKPPSVHQTCALVALTLIRVLAYTLSLVFYHRQVVIPQSGIAKPHPRSVKWPDSWPTFSYPRASTPAKTAAQSECSRPSGSATPSPSAAHQKLPPSRSLNCSASIETLPEKGKPANHAQISHLTAIVPYFAKWLAAR